MAGKNKLSPVDFLKYAAENNNVVSFDTETTGKNAFACKPLLYTLSAGKGAQIQSISLEPSEMTHKFLHHVFTDPTTTVVIHNSSFDCKIVHRYICPFRKIRAKIIDTLVLAWLVDNRGARRFGKPFSLKSLSQKYLNHKMHTLEEVFTTSPTAVRRKELEKAAGKLKKGWTTLAKRHEARFKRFMRQRHALLRDVMKTDTSMTRAEKSAAAKALTTQYKEYRYDYPRAEQAARRLLDRYRKEHAKLSTAIKASFIDYALDDAAVAIRLYWLFRKKLTAVGLDRWALVELACRNLATDMEINGVEIDYKLIDKLDESFGPEIDRVVKECFKIAGQASGQDELPFNIQSPREVSYVLHVLCKAVPDSKYVQLEESADSVNNREKNPTAVPWFKTSKRVLQYTSHPLAKLILEYRALVKLRGTYTEKLKKVRGRLHAFFRSSGTDTGRFASSGPNLQNIPSRSKLGKKIRESFVARKDHVLIVADLSQIELRVGATICNEPAMLETFNHYKLRDDGTRDYTVGDIHAVTQAGLQAICPFEVVREHAKVANFALLYGQSATSFALLYLLSFEIAEQLREAFFAKYSAIMAMLNELADLWNKYKIRSWRIPFSGRYRHWDRFDYVFDPETGDEQRVDTKISKGNILNTLVQGSAADVFKMALAMFWKYVVLNKKFENLIFPIMQVHDEVVVEVHKDIAVFVAKLLKYCMEYAWFNTPCPILADVHIVERWADGKNGKREKQDGNGKAILGEDGKPVMEAVLPEMNKELKYLTPADITACQEFIPQADPITIYTSYVAPTEHVEKLFK